jgi:predicted RNase H-like nuclease (RuvC/YqgF family)
VTNALRAYSQATGTALVRLAASHTPNEALREQNRLLQAALTEAQREIARLQARIADLEQEGDQHAAARAFTARAERAGETLVDEAGQRKLLNQVQAAEYLTRISGKKVQQYQISRWCKKGLFQVQRVPGHRAPCIYADSLYLPPRHSSGRKSQ